LFDRSQGVEAQTLAHVYQAARPTITDRAFSSTNVDLPAESPTRSAAIGGLICLDPPTLMISRKTGVGRGPDVLEAIVPRLRRRLRRTALTLKRCWSSTGN